jgi:hypothetical protein
MRGLLPQTGRGAGTRRATRVRRGVLALALLAVAFFPATGLASGQQTPACRGCRTPPVNAQRWTAQLPGQWAVGTGTTGIVPATGQAYAAVGGGVAAVGDGRTVTGYAVRDGRQLWQVTLDGPAGSSVISVRAWRGVVTAGLARPGAKNRTEVVIDSVKGTVVRQYPAAMFGGAVSASAAATVIVGNTTVTSYDNGTGKVRWQRKTGAGQGWRTDGQNLYVTESAGGFPGSAPVTGLRVVDLDSGAERTLSSPPGHPFAGTLAVAADGVVLFASAAGVTAYNGATGGSLWTIPGAVPEGTDPSAQLIYLTVNGALVGVNPLTGAVRTLVSGSAATGSAGMYVVRDGVALGLDSGPGGEAWGYNVAAGRVTWTVPGLPWPHYFADLSGLGGSAAESGDVVVIAACPHLAPATTPTSGTSPSGGGTPGASTTPAASATASAGQSVSASSSATQSPSVTPSPSATSTPAPLQLCADPELVALTL